MADLCVNIEDELTGDLPPEYLYVRSIALPPHSLSTPQNFQNRLELIEEEPTVVERRAEILPPIESNFVSRPATLLEYLQNYFLQVRENYRLSAEFDRIHYSHTIYQKLRRFIHRCVLRAKANLAT